MNTITKQPTSQTAAILHKRSNVEMYELAATRGNVPREFYTVNICEREVTLIKGFVTIINTNIDVFWQPNGRCYQQKTMERIHRGDLILKEAKS